MRLGHAGGQALQQGALSILGSFYFSDMGNLDQACLPGFLRLPLQWCLADVKAIWLGIGWRRCRRERPDLPAADEVSVDFK